MLHLHHQLLLSKVEHLGYKYASVSKEWKDGWGDVESANYGCPKSAQSSLDIWDSTKVSLLLPLRSETGLNSSQRDTKSRWTKVMEKTVICCFCLWRVKKELSWSSKVASEASAFYARDQQKMEYFKGCTNMRKGPVFAHLRKYSIRLENTYSVYTYTFKVT